MDMTLIQSTLTGLKTAFDIAKGISDLKSMTDVQAKVIELQSIILEAQSNAMAANGVQYEALTELRQLQEEISRLRAWDEEKKRYKLYSGPGTGQAVVYALKQEARIGDEPAHYICTTCYENGKKSILSPLSNDREGRGSYIYWTCPVCKSLVPTGFRGGVKAAFAE